MSIASSERAYFHKALRCQRATYVNVSRPGIKCGFRWFSHQSLNFCDVPIFRRISHILSPWFMILPGFLYIQWDFPAMLPKDLLAGSRHKLHRTWHSLHHRWTPAPWLRWSGPEGQKICRAYACWFTHLKMVLQWILMVILMVIDGDFSWILMVIFHGI
jgi:hypothetical protein